MNRKIEICIYHTDENKILLIVNHDTKCYGVITDQKIINLFRTKYELINIYSKSSIGINILISKLTDKEYERII